MMMTSWISWIAIFSSLCEF